MNNEELPQAAQNTEDPQQKFGHIRSFVSTRSHMTPSQKLALETLADKWAINFKPEILNFETLFGRQAKTIFEIGFGMGETSEKIAINRPEDNFIGVEVYSAGVGSLLKRIEQSNLSNLRLIQHDAVDVLNHMIADASLDGVHIYFPDPWPKKRHHKRRLIQAPLVALLCKKLKPGAYLHCATDWENYAEQMLEVLSAEAQLSNTAQTYAQKPEWRPLTKFEARGIRLGHGVWDLVFTRKEI